MGDVKIKFWNSILKKLFIKENLTNNMGNILNIKLLMQVMVHLTTIYNVNNIIFKNLWNLQCLKKKQKIKNIETIHINQQTLNMMKIIIWFVQMSK